MYEVVVKYLLFNAEPVSFTCSYGHGTERFENDRRIPFNFKSKRRNPSNRKWVLISTGVIQFSCCIHLRANYGEFHRSDSIGLLAVPSRTWFMERYCVHSWSITLSQQSIFFPSSKILITIIWSVICTGVKYNFRASITIWTQYDSRWRVSYDWFGTSIYKRRSWYYKYNIVGQRGIVKFLGTFERYKVKLTRLLLNMFLAVAILFHEVDCKF